MREIDVKPSAVLVSDIHGTELTPTNRIDNYIEAQETKLQFMQGISNRYKIPIIAAGDITDKWKTAPEALSMLIRNMRNWFATTGNHDLPYHNHELYEKSGVNVLEESGVLTNIDAIWELSPNGDFVMFGIHYGFDLANIPPVPEQYRKLPTLAVIHEFVWKGKLPFPGCKAPGVETLMNKLKQFDCIHVGDNHDPFTHRKGKQLLINAGSMMRSNIDQSSFKPRAYLWYAETNECAEVYLPIAQDVFCLEKAAKQKEDNKKMDAFIKNLANPAGLAKLDFIEKLKEYVLSNDVEPGVKKYLDIATD